MIEVTLNNDYYTQFWVGLMDGDGSIQVNNWKNQILQFRLVIKLKYTKNNYQMLKNIQTHLGGSVICTKNTQVVVWAENTKETIRTVFLPIFDKYPPITSRLQCQLAFLKTCIAGLNVHTYLLTRTQKYLNQKWYILETEKNIKTYSNKYLSIWLSGFIEAEGSFSIRKCKSIKTFSIGQNDDSYILKFIKEFFNAPNKVRKLKQKKDPSKSFYWLEIDSKINVLKVYSHCTQYPLLGEKSIQLQNFYNQITS
jgi:hypothetical protein